MKRILFQISLMLLVVLIGFSSVLITDVKADSMAGLNIPGTVKKDETFSVSLIVPADIAGAEADITVTFADGTKQSKKIAYVTGFSDPTVQFTASVVGSVKVDATNIIISDKNAKALENGGSKSGTLTVVDNNVKPEENKNTQPEVTFSSVNETVYATTTCNVRSSPSTQNKDNILGKLQITDKLTRVGVSTNGWSKVTYNGKEAYISSQYLTTEEVKLEFTNQEQTMYAKSNCNVRASYSTSSEKVGYLTKGQEVKVKATSKTWYKIDYDGKEAYVSVNLLSKDPIEEVENTTDDNNVVNNTASANTVMSKEEQISSLQKDIGVIPEVGVNTSSLLIVIAFFMAAVCGVIFNRITNKEDN